MRIPRTRGAVTGLLLMVLGAWGALVPFIGPYFDLVVGSDQAWDWSAGRLWLSVLPGVVALVGGLLLATSARRARAGLGAGMAIAAGAWLVVGPTVSRMWNDGTSAGGSAAGGTSQQVLELLTYYLALGTLMTALGAFALGRLAARGVREADPAREREAERPGDDDRFERADDRGAAPPAPSTAPAARAPTEPRRQ